MTFPRQRHPGSAPTPGTVRKGLSNGAKRAKQVMPYSPKDGLPSKETHLFDECVVGGLIPSANRTHIFQGYPQCLWCTRLELYDGDLQAL